MRGEAGKGLHQSSRHSAVGHFPDFVPLTALQAIPIARQCHRQARRSPCKEVRGRFSPAPALPGPHHPPTPPSRGQQLTWHRRQGQRRRVDCPHRSPPPPLGARPPASVPCCVQAPHAMASTEQPAPSGEALPELPLFSAAEAFVYKVPMATTSGHRAELWDVNNWFVGPAGPGLAHASLVCTLLRAGGGADGVRAALPMPRSWCALAPPMMQAGHGEPAGDASRRRRLHPPPGRQDRWGMSSGRGGAALQAAATAAGVCKPCTPHAPSLPPPPPPPPRRAVCRVPCAARQAAGHSCRASRGQLPRECERRAMHRRCEWDSGGGL